MGEPTYQLTGEDRDRAQVETGSPYTLADVLANQMIAAAHAVLEELIPSHVVPLVDDADRRRYIAAMDMMGEAIMDAAAVVADTIKE